MCSSDLGDFKEFTSEEGYAWHKQNAKWAADLTEEDRAIVNNYVGFGYSEINRLLRGDPPTTFQNRPATEAERQAYLDGNSAGEIPKLPNGAYYDKWGSEVAERVPDPKRTEIAQRQIEKLDNLIATKGVVLKEPITTLRATYLPTATLEDFEVGKVITESGFTSVMVGDANGRYENYIAWGKAESLNQRFGTINHPENGLALGLKIQIPKGARVLDADAVRKHSDPDRETESELILPSGSRFRVKAVNTYAGVSRLSDFQTPYHEVILEYIPPTSEAVEQKNSVMKGADFDESKHPRNPAGSPNSTGGQFVSTDEGGNSTFLEKPNASDRIINSPILTIGVSDAELEALESYITIGYSDMNALLRKFNISIPSFELDYVIDEIKSLTNVLDRQSLPENVTVYRGTDSMLNKALKAGVGGIIDDNGFVSTTLDETYAKNFRSSHSYVRIQLPAGAKAGYSSTSIVDGRSEHEVILQRGSRFRVVSVSNAGIPTLQWLSASPAEIPAGTGKIAKSEDNRFVWSSEDIVWSNSSVTKGADFDESKHPRNPAGSPEGTGGEFVSVKSEIRNAPIDPLGTDAKDLNAVHEYCAYAYENINNIARYGAKNFNKAGVKKYSAYIKSITSLLDKASFPLNATVYRATTPMLKEALTVGVGGELTDNGFLSCTMDEDYAKTGVMSAIAGDYVRIQLPTGAKAGFIRTSPGFEEEVLIQRGSTFRVVGIENGIPTLRWIKAEPKPITKSLQLRKAVDGGISSRFLWGLNEIEWLDSPSIVKSADFDESKHPRNPAGSPEGTGGEFTSTGGIGSAKSTAEAVQSFSKAHPNIKVDGWVRGTGDAIRTDADERIAIPTMAQFDKLLKDFPDVNLDRIAVEQQFQDSTAMARTYGSTMGIEPDRPNSAIVFNPYYLRSTATPRELENSKRLGWLTSDDPASIATHEFGHALYAWIRKEGATNGAEAALMTFAQTQYGDMMATRDSIADKLPLTVEARGSTRAEAVDAKWRESTKLSNYAQKNIQEMWAEGFVQIYHTPKDRWSPYTQAQYELLQEFIIPRMSKKAGA